MPENLAKHTSPNNRGFQWICSDYCPDFCFSVAVFNCKSLIINDWLPRKDSNLDKEIQNLSCYHYTTRHCRGTRAKTRSCFCASDDAAAGRLTNPSHHLIWDRPTRPLRNRPGQEVEPLHPPGEIRF